MLSRCNKITSLVVCFMIVFTSLGLIPKVHASPITKTVTHTFEEAYDSQEKSVELTVPNALDVISVSVNQAPNIGTPGATAAATINRSNKVLVSVWGGQPTGDKPVHDTRNETHTLTNSTNSFPATYSYASGGYSGELAKVGLAESDVVTGHEKVITETLIRNTNSFPEKTSYNKDGYSGELERDGNFSIHYEGDSKSVTDYLTDNSNSFPTFITYNKDGYTGEIQSYGSSFVESGTAAKSETRNDSLTNSNPNNLPPYISYNSGGFKGTLTGNGVYVSSGSAANSRTQTDSRQGSNPNNFPHSISYNSGGYSGTLSGNSPYVTSGSAGGSRSQSTYQTSSNPASLPTAVSYNSGGYSGTLYSTGNPFVTSGSAGGSRTQTDYRTSSVNSFPVSLSYSSGGYTGTLSRSGTSYVSSGSAGGSRTQGGYRTGSSSGGFPNSISYNSDGYTGTLMRNGSPYVTSGSASGSRTQTDYRTSLSNSFPNTISYSSGGYTGTLYKSGGVTFQNGVYRQNYSGTVSKPDTRQWRQDYSGTVTKPDTRIYRQNYSGTVTKPDTRQWRRDYSGTVTKPDTRQWRKDYSGTVYKPDTRIWRQDYSGTVTRPDSRIWRQNYSGVAYDLSTRQWKQNYKGTVKKPDITTWYQDYAGEVSGLVSKNYWNYQVTVVVELKDTTPPFTPSGLRHGSATTSSIPLMWDASYDNAGDPYYDIFINDQEVPYISTTNTFVDVTSLESGTPYTFRVRARDAAGNTSAFSNSIRVYTEGVPVGGIGGDQHPYSITFNVLNAGQMTVYNDALGYKNAVKVKQGLKADIILKFSEVVIVNMDGNTLTIDDGNGNVYEINLSHGLLNADLNGQVLYSRTIGETVEFSNLKLNYSAALALGIELEDGWVKVAEHELSVTDQGGIDGINFGYVLGIDPNILTMEVKYTVFQELFYDKTYFNIATALITVGLGQSVKVPESISELLKNIATSRSLVW